MKPTDVKSSIHISLGVEYKNIFGKSYTPNWSEVFVFKIVKDTEQTTCKIKYLNGEKIVGIFYEKELQKTSQTVFSIKKVIMKKGDKLCVKSKVNNTINNLRLIFAKLIFTSITFCKFCDFLANSQTFVPNLFLSICKNKFWQNYCEEYF